MQNLSQHKTTQNCRFLNHLLHLLWTPKRQKFENIQKELKLPVVQAPKKKKIGISESSTLKTQPFYNTPFAH